MKEKKIITKCEIKRSTIDPSVNAVFVWFDDQPDWQVLFTYFPDEIGFNEEELTGLTEKEAKDLRLERDLEYLRN